MGIFVRWKMGRNWSCRVSASSSLISEGKWYILWSLWERGGNANVCFSPVNFFILMKRVLVISQTQMDFVNINNFKRNSSTEIRSTKRGVSIRRTRIRHGLYNHKCYFTFVSFLSFYNLEIQSYASKYFL